MDKCELSDLAVGFVVRDLLEVRGGVIYQVLHIAVWALGLAPFNTITTGTDSSHFNFQYL